MFGPPQIVKPDLGREFQAEFAYRCTTDGSEVDPASLESPTQNAITEREGKSYKMMFAKASLEYGETTDEEIIRELIDIVTMMKNRLTHRSGYSAVHRALGYTPTMPGNLMSEDQDHVAHASALQIGDVCLQRQARMREAAGRAFFSAECTDAIARAITSGHRRIEKFEIGHLVCWCSWKSSTSQFSIPKAQSHVLARTSQSSSSAKSSHGVRHISRSFVQGLTRTMSFLRLGRRCIQQRHDSTAVSSS